MVQSGATLDAEASIVVNDAVSMIGVESFGTNAACTDCTSNSNEANCEKIDTEEDDIDDNGSSDLKPDDLTYPGFIVFALLGPIVPVAMISYHTELFMTRLPPVTFGETSNAGKAEMRRTGKIRKGQTLYQKHAFK